MATPLSVALLDILVCPVCHQHLERGHAETAAGDSLREWLRCSGCGLCYPIQDGIPVMLEERATHEPRNES